MPICLKKRMCALLISSVLVLSLTACGTGSAKLASKTTFVLNTAATITLYGSDDESIIDACFDICRKYENMFSRTIADSEIAKLNSREIENVSDETAELLSLGEHYSRLSDGAFDLTIEPLSVLWDFSSGKQLVPKDDDIAAAVSKVDYRNVRIDGNRVSFKSEDTRLDLGAIAKGYIADKVKEYLISQGIESAIINLGGNILCVGGKTDSEGFGIGIQKPFSNETIAKLKVRDLSVVSSGVYERCFEKDGVLYHHLLSTKTGMPIDNGLLSVTIISKSSADGDALSTTCFALGPERGMELINSLDDTYAVFITEDYALHLSDGTEAAFEIEYP